jgi:hypothetical protein
MSPVLRGASKRGTNQAQQELPGQKPVRRNRKMSFVPRGRLGRGRLGGAPPRARRVPQEPADGWVVVQEATRQMLDVQLGKFGRSENAKTYVKACQDNSVSRLGNDLARVKNVRNTATARSQ